MPKYKTKSKEITAIQIKQKMVVKYTMDGAEETVNPGDWLIDNGPGQFFMSDEEFKKTYDLVPETELVPKTPYTPFTVPEYPWPTNPQWPNGPIYWTSSPYTQCAGSHTGSVEQLVPTESHVLCFTIPKCSDEMPHSFPGEDTVGDGVVRCLKCNKTVSEALGAFSITKDMITYSGALQTKTGAKD